MVSPVLKQSLSFRRDLPLARAGKIPPRIQVSTYFVDNRCRVVLLLLCGDAFPLIEDNLLLSIQALALLGLRNRCYKFRLAAEVFKFLCRLAVIVQLPVPPRTLIGRVQNGGFKKWIGHRQLC